jgi:hypothetical protein
MGPKRNKIQFARQLLRGTNVHLNLLSGTHLWFPNISSPDHLKISEVPGGPLNDRFARLITVMHCAMDAKDENKKNWHCTLFILLLYGPLE